MRMSKYNATEQAGFSDELNELSGGGLEKEAAPLWLSRAMNAVKTYGRGLRGAAKTPALIGAGGGAALGAAGGAAVADEGRGLSGALKGALGGAALGGMGGAGFGALKKLKEPGVAEKLKALLKRRNSTARYRRDYLRGGPMEEKMVAGRASNAVRRTDRAAVAAELAKLKKYLQTKTTP